MTKRIINLSFLMILLFVSCRKTPKDNSKYQETLTYSDDNSIYQRVWSFNSGKDEVAALHLEDDADLIGGTRVYYMNIALEDKKDGKKMWAYIYDYAEGILNGKHTLRRLYNYDGERYNKNGQLNFKGTFEETIVYFDTDSIMPNDTTIRTGTFVFEYKGKEKN